MKINLPACFIFIFLILCMANAAGQSSKETYRFGLNVNMPFIPEQKDTFSPRTGWGIWASAEFEMKNTTHWTFRPGVGYNNYGYTQNYHTAAGVAARRKITEHYFDLSGLFAYKVSPGANSVRVVGGAGASVLMSRRASEPDVRGINITRKTIDDKKSGSIYLLLNAGLSLPVSNRIDLGILYSHGLPHKVYPLDVTGHLSMVQVQINFKLEKNRDTTGRAANTNRGRDDEKEVERPYKRDSLVLLVRLDENLTRINLLKQQGEAAEAERERLYTEEQNKKIMQAFRDEFKLFPVLFFYDTDSKAALRGEFKGLFLNPDLQRDTAIELPQRQYLFAEFGRQFDEVSQTSGMYGFVIYDDKFRQVPPPFPSFISDKYGFLSKQEVIARVNKKLKKYFSGKK